MRASATLKAGDWVEVKSAEAIRATLDEHAQLEGMPFMPEMARFCGRRFRVESRAHKSCDTVDYVGGRRLWGAVHLEGLRCDGEAHGGCEALCLLFWKEGWLTKVDGPGADAARGFDGPAAPLAPETARLVQLGTRRPGEPADAPDPTYVCQATQLLVASVPLKRSDVMQYLEDFTSGNVGVWRMVRAFTFLVYETLIGGRYGLGAPLRALYELWARLVGAPPYPSRRGRIPAGQKTPQRKLDLVAGELVRVKQLPDILETVDENLRNRGMGFHSEMVPFTGRTFRVLRRIEKLVNEKTGKMIVMKNDAVILEGATCQSRYINNCRRFCPRAVYLYFREIWLERVEEQPARGTRDAAA
ncbi:MAG: hypothetical protein U0229_16705 [Anaeromyxobacter sp.]